MDAPTAISCIVLFIMGVVSQLLMDEQMRKAAYKLWEALLVVLETTFSITAVSGWRRIEDIPLDTRGRYTEIRRRIRLTLRRRSCTS